MKTKVRLLFTDDCNRKCKGCCNRNWTGEPPIGLTWQEVREFDEIYITGGEPMLYPKKLKKLIKKLKTKTNKIFLYTAMPYPKKIFIDIMSFLDGASVTLHTSKDYFNFYCAQYYATPFEGKSMRLNDFTNKKIKFTNGAEWHHRPMTWIIDAPLPDGEIFAKLV